MTWLLFALAFSSDKIEFFGTAKNKSGNVVYLEEHKVNFEKGVVKDSVTRYLDPETKKEIAILTSKYQPHKWMPNYYYKDHRFNKHNGVDAIADEITVFDYDKKGKRRERVFPYNTEMIGGQGFHYFIQDHLEQLARGENVQTRFVLPGNLNYYRFVISKSDRKKVEEDEIYLSMRPDSLLRVFVSTIYMTYNLKNKRLMGYEGQSNLLGSDGKAIDVRITYEY